MADRIKYLINDFNTNGFRMQYLHNNLITSKTKY
jgi:hypothetical protein